MVYFNVWSTKINLNEIRQYSNPWCNPFDLCLIDIRNSKFIYLDILYSDFSHQRYQVPTRRSLSEHHVELLTL